MEKTVSRTQLILNGSINLQNFHYLFNIFIFNLEIYIHRFANDRLKKRLYLAFVTECTDFRFKCHLNFIIFVNLFL